MRNDNITSQQVARDVRPRSVGGFIVSPDIQSCYTAARHIEAQQQRIEALERELAEARKDAERYRMPPLNNDLREILGFMCFQCISIAKLLRTSGYEIKTTAEDEQATVIHFFLSMYAEHGAGWQDGAKVALKAMGEAIDASAMKEQA